MKLSKLQCILLPVLLLFIYLSMSSYSGGISGQYTAGCTCHGGGVLNPNTLVNVAGPTGYNHSQVITYTVTVSNAAEVAAGFNLKCNIGQITSVGSGINTWSTTEISHNTPRTLSAGTATWTFQWTAPATGSTPLQFNIAGNAVNLSGGPDPGDAWNFGTIAPIPLPIEFNSFQVTTDRDMVKCFWRMSDQKGVHHFEIEKSTDGVNFGLLTSVDKKLSSANEVEYAFWDKEVVSGQNYFYRVKEEMLNGDAGYTQVKNIMLRDKNNPILLYPSVFSGNQIHIQGVDLSQKQYTIRIAAVDGKVLYQHPLSDNLINLPGNFSGGTYIASIVSNEGILYSGLIFKK